LEVSSPGFDRPVRKPGDFRRFVGEPIRIVTHTPVNGRKKFTGSLKDFQDERIILECDGMVYEISLDNLKKAALNR
jgi:ribosome maturation factor RimP